jgi:hypothetical protein
MRPILLTSCFLPILTALVGCSRSGSSGPIAEADPVAAQAAAKLPGRWALTFANGVTHSSEVVFQAAGRGRFRLNTSLRLKGVYELRGNRLVLVEPDAKGNEGFAWEIRSAEDLALVAQPADYVGIDLRGATLKRVGEVAPGAAGLRKGNGPAGATPNPGAPGPKTFEGTPNLPGRWQLTLPRGATYEVVVSAAGPGRFRFDKAVNFTGVYELKDGRLVMVQPTAVGNDGLVWEARGAEELTLVAEPPGRGSSYLGATMKRVGDTSPGVPGPK